MEISSAFLFLIILISCGSKESAVKMPAMIPTILIVLLSIQLVIKLDATCPELYLSRMQVIQEKLDVSDSIGKISIEIYEPPNLQWMMSLAHGAGAGMNHRFMVALAKALASEGIGTLRFNFPYMENGKKRPDVPAVAEKTVGVVLDRMKRSYADTKLFASGKSFGGRMTSQYLSKHQADELKGIIFYGFPLHPAGSPATMRADHLQNINLPMLFLQGTKDTLAENELIEGVCRELPTATLDKIEGADHGFMISRKERIDLLVTETLKWVTSIGH
jgi:uncharacterized protein